MPALILMDLTMPVRGGPEATRLIRGVTEIREVVIVAFTALHSNECRASALAAGCDDYVQKPLGMDELSGLLQRHIGNGRS